MGEMGDYKVAARMRDVVARLVGVELDRQRPPYRYATVNSIDRENRRCTVTYPGDSVPVPVRMGSIQPLSTGQVVRIAGQVGDRYIDDVMGLAWSAEAEVPTHTHEDVAEHTHATAPEHTHTTVPEHTHPAPGVVTGSYLPSHYGLTRGSTGAIRSGQYWRQGDMVTAQVYIKGGTGASIGATVEIGLPFQAANAYGTGTCVLTDSGTRWHSGSAIINYNNMTSMYLVHSETSGAGLLGSGAPFTFTNGDVVQATMTYEAV